LVGVTDRSPVKKALALRSAVRNWPLVVLDKLGLRRFCTYEFRLGVKVVCRARSNDINEAVAILAGLEYPAEYLHIRAGGVVVDVGAHLGSFVMFFDALHRGTPYQGFAFEPHRENFSLLARNVAANNITRFQLIEAAVTGRDGSVYLRTDCEPDVVAVSDEVTETRAQSHKLSTFCQRNGIVEIDLLKIDAEGSEYELLAADYDFIRRRVRGIILEYHNLSDVHTLDWVVEKTHQHFHLEKIRLGKGSGVLFLANASLRQTHTQEARPVGLGGGRMAE